MVNQTLSGLRGRITKKIIDSLNLQPAIEKIPNQLVDTIQPILNVEPQKNIIVRNSSTAGAIWTASSTKRTFITGILAVDGGMIDPAYMTITDTTNKTSIIARLASGGGQVIALNFTEPIEIEKGSSITLTGTGVPDSYWTIFIYEDD